MVFSTERTCHNRLLTGMEQGTNALKMHKYFRYNTVHTSDNSTLNED